MQKMLNPILALAITFTLVATPAAKSRVRPARLSLKPRVNQVANPQPVQTEQFIRTELFFGSGKPDGSDITEAEWQQFLNAEITPCFPDGLTVMTGLGQYRGANGIIVRERSVVVSLMYPVSARRTSHEKIERIRVAYKNAFQQESVLRVDSVLPVRVSF